MQSTKIKSTNDEQLHKISCQLAYREEELSSTVSSTAFESFLTTVSNKLCLSYLIYQK